MLRSPVTHHWKKPLKAGGCVTCSVVPDSLWPRGLPGSAVHGILQARILEWVASPFSRGSSQPREWCRQILCHLSTREAPTLVQNHSQGKPFSPCSGAKSSAHCFLVGWQRESRYAEGFLFQFCLCKGLRKDWFKTYSAYVVSLVFVKCRSERTACLQRCSQRLPLPMERIQKI